MELEEELAKVEKLEKKLGEKEVIDTIILKFSNLDSAIEKCNDYKCFKNDYFKRLEEMAKEMI